MMGFIVSILVIIFFLAIIGLGFDTFFSSVKKGADKLGITPVMESAADDAIEIAENASRDLVSNSLPANK
jgi:uncharacterized protein (UPF0333 family)